MELIYIILFILFVNKLFKNTNYYKNKFINLKNLESNQPKFAFDYSQSNLLGMNWSTVF